MARVANATGLTRDEVRAACWVASTPPSAASDPASFEALGARRSPCARLTTAAAALREARTWTFETARDFDAEDWWFGARVDASGPCDRAQLRFAGLGGIAELWLDGERVAGSNNAFVPLEIDVTNRPASELVIRCASLDAALRTRRPRPRWKTRIVPRQELRYFRQPLLGRMPSWTPPCPAVGPYGAVTLERWTGLFVRTASARAELSGDDGLVHVALTVDAFGARIEGAVARSGDASAALELTADGRLEGTLRIERPARWWPHTHGAPARHPLSVEVRVDGALQAIDLGRVGFRTIEVDRGPDGDGFALVVNGVRIFIRGACWAPLDPVALASSPAEHDLALAQLTAAGMNMTRLSGTMLYGEDALYDACDAHGVLVWQDFAFANLDYPVDDAAFEAEARREARAFLQRVETSPSLAVACGGSEVTQQAAMMGLPREAWASPLFDAWLPEAARAVRPDIAYVDNSPSGGALPFQFDAGVSHYYGVSAYLLPQTDARRAGVRFTTECVAFAHVPSTRLVERLLGDGERASHSPRWKSRVPRDRSAGWDFDDVRDHYVRELFGVDPMRLRYADPARYLELGRVAAGEVVYGAFAEWRRAASTCSGALVWMLRDLWPGAGFGLVDATGQPKAALHCAARALQPVSLLCANEGGSGLVLHAVNDGPAPLAATLSLTLYRDGAVEVGRADEAITVPPRGAVERYAEAMLGHFHDTCYTFRFGPPGFDVAHARLVAPTGELYAEAFHLPLGLARDRVDDTGLEAKATPAAGGAYTLELTTASFAQSIAIEAGAFEPTDDRFHMAPRATKTVTLRPTEPAARLAGTATPLNARYGARITIVKP